MRTKLIFLIFFIFLTISCKKNRNVSFDSEIYKSNPQYKTAKLEKHIKELSKLLRNKKFKDAEKLVNSTKDKFKDNPVYHYYKAFVYFSNYKFEDALKSIDKSIELNNKIYVFHLYKATILFRIGRFEKSIKAIDFAEKLKPESYDVQTLKSKALFEIGEYDLSLKYTNKILKGRDNIFAYKQRGHIYLEKQDFQNAIKDFEHYLDKKSDLKLVKNLIMISIVKKDTKLADKYVNKLKNEIKERNDAEIKYYEAMVLVIQTKFIEAKRILESIDYEKSRNPEYNNRLGEIYLSLKEYDKGLKFVEKSIQKFKNNRDLLFLQSAFLVEMDKSNKAINVLKNSLKGSFHDFGVINKIAEIYFLKKEYKKGIEFIDKYGKKIYEKNAEIMHKKSLFYSKLEDHVNCAKIIEDIKLKFPKYNDIYFLSFFTYKKLGMKFKAFEELKYGALIGNKDCKEFLKMMNINNEVN